MLRKGRITSAIRRKEARGSKRIAHACCSVIIYRSQLADNLVGYVLPSSGHHNSEGDLLSPVHNVPFWEEHGGQPFALQSPFPHLGNNQVGGLHVVYPHDSLPP